MEIVTGIMIEGVYLPAFVCSLHRCSPVLNINIALQT